jgi:hypothetical protein
MIQTIHEVLNPFDVVVRELGDAVVLFLFSGSISSNPQFLVRIYKTGELRVVDIRDCLMYGDPGNKFDNFIPTAQA